MFYLYSSYILVIFCLYSICILFVFYLYSIYILLISYLDLICSLLERRIAQDALQILPAAVSVQRAHHIILRLKCSQIVVPHLQRQDLDTAVDWRGGVGCARRATGVQRLLHAYASSFEENESSLSL